MIHIFYFSNFGILLTWIFETTTRIFMSEISDFHVCVELCVWSYNRVRWAVFLSFTHVWDIRFIKGSPEVWMLELWVLKFTKRRDCKKNTLVRRRTHTVDLIKRELHTRHENPWFRSWRSWWLSQIHEVRKLKKIESVNREVSKTLRYK